jgi:SAM-dependent methyltransferase
MIKIFDLYGKYYNILYENKNYKQESIYICKLIKKYTSKKNILEFGSGTGSHAHFFCKKKYKVHGIEKSKNMIINCRKINGFTYEKGDICKIKLKKKYDIVLSLFHVFSYQVSNANINKFFKNANLHLNPGGLLGFDYWFTPAIKFQKPEIRIRQIKKNNLKLTKIAEPSQDYSKKIVNIKYTLGIENLINGKDTGVIRENHTMRHFSLSEISSLAKKYNFKILHTRELITNKIPNKNTWAVFCLMQKQ